MRIALIPRRRPEGLPVIADSFRFSQASHGMIAVAAIRTAMPKWLGLGSLYPSIVKADTVTTKAASTNNSVPAMWDAFFSA